MSYNELSKSRKSELAAIRVSELIHSEYIEKYEVIRVSDDFENSIIEEAMDMAKALPMMDSRTVSIITTSFIDDTIKNNFINRWNINSSKLRDAYFGSNGPLNSFQQKVIISQSIGWITEDGSSQIDILRKIRNQFSHNHRVHALSDNMLFNLCNSLIDYESSWSDIPEYLEAISSADKETKFRMRIFIVAMYKISEMISCSKLLYNGLPPHFRSSNGWDGLMDIQKGLSRSVVNYAWRSLGIYGTCDEDFKAFFKMD